MSASIERYKEGHAWESLAGYSRAVRAGSMIAVSGTTANGPAGTVLHIGDTYGQTRAALEQSIAAVENLGGARSSIYRSRVLLAPSAHWEAAARAHADVLGSVAPANSMFFVHGLIGTDFLVEIEIDALVVSE